MQLRRSTLVFLSLASQALFLLTPPALPAQNIAPPALLDSPAAANPLARTIADEIRLAGDYLIGRGVVRDPSQAAYWYRKAADLGDPNAQNQLGYLYIWGIGVDRDEAQAAKWFTRASGSGSQPAKLNLAVMYIKGVGVPRDVPFAIDLLHQLAEKDNSRAECYLGFLSMEGLGMPLDRHQAEKWFTRAAKAKNPEAEYALGRFWSVEPEHQHDLARAADFLRRSARAGYVPAMHALGLLLVQHPPVAKHPDEAIAALRRAAEAGTWQASDALGILARDGRGGLSPNPGEAFFWFNVAVAQGGPDTLLQMRGDLLHVRDLLTPDEQSRQIDAAEDWLHSHPHEDLFVFDNPVRNLFPIQEVYASAPTGD
jgi:TPR repeat protein